MGKVLVSKAVLHSNVVLTFAVESLACMEAVRMGFNLGMEVLIIEGDSLIVIKKCKSGFLRQM